MLGRSWLTWVTFGVLGVTLSVGCGGRKHCGDGGMSVRAGGDGGVVCVGGPGEDEDGGTDARRDAGADARADARADGSTPFCGDGLCNGSDTCSTCPTDCGVCPPFCGDGLCNGSETCSSCSTDCGFCPPDAAVDARPDARPDAGTCPQFQDVFPGSQVSVSTIGAGLTSTASCGSGTNTAPDRWYRFYAASSGSCHAATTGLSSGFDTVVSVRSTCGGTVDIACNDDAVPQQVGPSSVSWSAVSGTYYYIVVDGYNGSSGACTLTVTCP